MTYRNKLTVLGLALALVALFGLAHTGSVGVRAQAAQGTCTAPTTANSTTCTFNTTVPVAPGGTLTKQITAPAGAAITNVTGIPSGCTGTPATTTAPVTITCAVGSSGIPVGTPLSETFTLVGATTSITEIVTYNANGPIAAAAVPAPTTGTGSCTATAAGANTFTCTAFPAQATASNGTFTITFNNATPNGTLQVTSATAGNCAAGTLPATPSTSATVTFTCGAGQTIAAGSTVTANVTVTAPTGTTANPPTVTTVANANGPSTVQPAVPNPVQTTVSFSVSAPVPTPVLTAISPVSGPVGTTVILQGTGLSGATAVTFGNQTLTPTNVTANAVSFVVPTGLPADSSFNIGVTTPGGTSNALQFIVTAAVTATPSPTPSPSPSPVAGVQVTYPSGWNIVAGPTGTVITGNSGPLYTFQTGDVNYEVLPFGSPLVAGRGYWAFFAVPTTVTIPISNPASVTVNLPANQYIQIGNPGSGTATITDPTGILAQVVTWDPVTQSYVNATVLGPGQGAWAFSYTGGPITLTSR